MTEGAAPTSAKFVRVNSWRFARTDSAASARRKRQSVTKLLPPQGAVIDRVCGDAGQSCLFQFADGAPPRGADRTAPGCDAIFCGAYPPDNPVTFALTNGADRAGKGHLHVGRMRGCSQPAVMADAASTTRNAVIATTSEGTATVWPNSLQNRRPHLRRPRKSAVGAPGRSIRHALHHCPFSKGRAVR